MTIEIPPDQLARMRMLKRSDVSTPSHLQIIKCQRLSGSATVPTRSYEHDAGWDLYSSEEQYILPQHRKLIKTSIAIAIPSDQVGLVWPRSGLSVKSGIDVFAGVIDSGYKGEVQVCLYNSSEVCFGIKKGDRIAQIIFHEIPKIKMREVDELDDSKRGEDGFGSSGA